jgi:hypothetical protein
VTADASDPGVGFLVVGSPRSGTTLVQRLACEIPGVAMPPETHFFTRFAMGLVARHRFPIEGKELVQVVGGFAADHGDLAVDVDAVVGALGGRCAGPFALFDALVRQLAGPAQVWGEKTPNHLVWWRPISRAAPWVRFVVVVRDPRAVVASNLEMPWREDPTLPPWGDQMHLAFAALWAFYQGQVPRMTDELGPERCLVVRYEDVVAEPDGARARLATFLGLDAGATPQTAPAGIVQPWESWKTRALDPVSGDRVSSWEGQLDARRAGEIAVVCRSAMRRFGYTDGVPGLSTATRTWVRLGPRTAVRVARYARGRRVHLRRIERLVL